MGKSVIVRHVVEADEALGGTHHQWVVDVNGKRYYVSHQSHIPGVGPECMAFRAEGNGPKFKVTSWRELAVSHSADPLDALADVVEQLEGRGK